jgi:chromosome segregation protein
MLRSQLTPLASKKEEFETRLGEAKKALADVSSQEERERGLISRLQHRRTKLGPRRTSLEQKNSEFEQKLQELQSELQSVQLEKARLEIQLDSAEKGLRKLKREIQLSLVEKPGEIERNIISLEEQLQQMGPINFRALSDFKTTEDRHASERAKYDKLVGEKESIICAIEEIDRHKTEVFMHTFEKVSENFSQIFSELSPGGRAGLVLENPERPLEGGLEIEANPAGKEITRIGAMSGGEKALTALAFIFALQRMKPTAIYVLDEIDAHLDDENLRRVAQMLKRLASNSQIIVVTLHEGMMAVADRLFGVSMDKVGVSHLFSVDLKGVGG